jgi:hypothetical protein
MVSGKFDVLERRATHESVLFNLCYRIGNDDFLKREREALDDEIREAHQRSQNANDVGSYRTYYRQDGSTHIEFEPDNNYIMQCRAEYEHLSGPVYYNMQSCAELIHNKLMRATVAVNMIEQKTNATNNTLQTYVENGKKFLDLAAQYIEQYKE